MKFFIIIVPIIMLVATLSWILFNYFTLPEELVIEGYVLEKEQNRILIVDNVSQEEYLSMKNETINQLMEQQVELIYLDYKSLFIDEGDHVKAWVTGVDSSYPAHASPDKIVKE